MLRDYLVNFAGLDFECVDRGFIENEPVDVVIRPEDIQIVSETESKLKGEVKTVTFKGVHYEMIVQSNGISWKIHSTEMEPAGSRVGLRIIPDAIHVMRKAAAK